MAENVTVSLVTCTLRCEAPEPGGAIRMIIRGAPGALCSLPLSLAAMALFGTVTISRPCTLWRMLYALTDHTLYVATEVRLSCRTTPCRSTQTTRDVTCGPGAKSPSLPTAGRWLKSVARSSLTRTPPMTWYPTTSNRADGSSTRSMVRGSGMVTLGWPEGLVSWYHCNRRV